VLFVNDTALQFYGKLDFCEYVEVTRPEEGDSSFDLGHKRYVFVQRVSVAHREFIKVSHLG